MTGKGDKMAGGGGGPTALLSRVGAPQLRNAYDVRRQIPQVPGRRVSHCYQQQTFQMRIFSLTITWLPILIPHGGVNK
jgi:hypothetical protein